VEAETVSKPVTTIDRIENPTESFFRENYLEKGRPVVIVNTENQPSQLTWDFERLVEYAGHCKIPVYDWGEKGPTVHDEFVITHMPLREAVGFARQVVSPETQRYSVCQLSLSQVPPLRERYRVPAVLEHSDELDRLPWPFRETRRRALFLSFFRGMHWHNAREVIAQVAAGRKRFVLFSPEDSRYLYPRKFLADPLAWFDETEAVFCSEVPFEDGIENIDHDRFPLFRKATPIEVELGPGDSLFIPTHWWHYTYALEPCVLIADFWDAPLRRWGWPIAWRSLIMKPYRKYLYRQLLKLKKFSRDERILGPEAPAEG
jgi:hypothetical protein